MKIPDDTIKYLRRELWTIMMTRIAFKELERKCKYGEVPAEEFNQAVTVTMFESMQRCQIMSLCRLDDDRNISFHTITKHGQKLGFSDEEIKNLSAQIKKYRNLVNALKTKHRNVYIGHLSKSFDGEHEIINFDDVIQKAYNVMTLICREQLEFIIPFGCSGEVTLTQSFSGKRT